MPALDANERTLLRRKSSDSETSLPDIDVDFLFDDAEAEYSGYARRVIFQAVLVARIEELWMAAIKHVTYRQNQASENLSDIAKGLKERLEREQARLNKMVTAANGGPARILKMNKIPSRDKEYPSG